MSNHTPTHIWYNCRYAICQKWHPRDFTRYCEGKVRIAVTPSGVEIKCKGRVESDFREPTRHAIQIPLLSVSDTLLLLVDFQTWRVEILRYATGGRTAACADLFCVVMRHEFHSVQLHRFIHIIISNLLTMLCVIINCHYIQDYHFKTPNFHFT